MVALLDLPTEILEMILRPIVRSANPTISTPASTDASKVKTLHDTLLLRLVHSRFRAVIDPLAFQSIACIIQHKRDGGDARTSQKKGGIFALLDSCSELVRNVKNIEISCRHGESIRQSPSILDKLETILRQSHTKIQCLSFMDDTAQQVPRNMPLYTNLSPSHWPALRKLSLLDVHFVFCLPQILAAAPVLHSVALSGGTLSPLKALESLAASVPIPLLAKGSASNPITLLKLHDCVEAWMYQFLSRLKLHARAVAVLDTNKYAWRVTSEQQVAGLQHMADSDDFIFVACQTIDRKHPPYNSVGFAQRMAVMDIQRCLSTIIPKQNALCVHLKTKWEGRKIDFVVQRPVENLAEVMRSPNVTLSQVLRFVRLGT